MAKRIRTLYKWDDGRLQRVGSISEARLWAWEYREAAEVGWEFEAEDFHDTVRVWTTDRPDLGPEQLFIGDNSQLAAGSSHRERPLGFPAS
jgi:hypothetical protein